MNIKVLVGKNIKSVRNAKNISQEKLAHSADLDRTYISSIEKGIRNISITTLLKIANALDVKPTELLKNHENEL